MLKIRIIPTLLWRDHSLVKSKKYQNWRKVGYLVQSVKVYNTRNVDEIIFLDISQIGKPTIPDYSLVEDVAKHCFVPLTIGGNIRTLADVQNIIERGADKISLNSVLRKNIKFIKDVAKNFGSQAIVVSVDYRIIDERPTLFFEGGTKKKEIDFFDYVKQIQDLGAGEILLNAIDNDGMMNGYDLMTLEKVSKISNIPIIISGGANSFDHMYQAINFGASAVSAASIYHFTEKTPKRQKYLSNKGILIRNSLKRK